VILLFFLTDFVKISLATDNFRWSQKPDTWKINGAVKVSAILGFIVTLESFLLLYFVLVWFGISLNNPALYTFTFEILFYSATLLIFNVRERRFFWSSMPSKTLLFFNIISIVIATVIVTTGIPGLTPVALEQTLIILGFSALFSFVINDLAKYALVKVGIRW
jgi:H+-transporting ATPase